MTSDNLPVDKLLSALQERAKELNCLYEVEEILARPEMVEGEVFQRLVKIIPPGWQYPDICQAEITYQDQTWRSGDFRPTSWLLKTPIVVQDVVEGELRVYYTEWRPTEDQGPFLKEEIRLIKTIAERMSHHLFYQQLKTVRHDFEQATIEIEAANPDEWRAPLALLRRTDIDLYQRIARKMINHLFWTGVEEAGSWVLRGAASSSDPDIQLGEVNAPGVLAKRDDSWLLTDEPFELASRHISDQEILDRVQRWMVEDRASQFIKVLHSQLSSLPEIADALRRLHHVVGENEELPLHTVSGLRVALIHRLLTEQLEFITVAKEYVGTHAFERILDRVLMLSDSYGRLGGKASGIILAHRILRKTKAINDEFRVKVPKSWFVVSSSMRRFIAYNDLEDVLEQKYKGVDEVRHDYPNIIQLFKSSRHHPEMIKGVSVVLDEFVDKPLVVRSSSLLEDRVGTAFSGKYKSLFLANQGTKEERTAALLDAIAEIYASTFGPDPIEYRKEHGLLDFNEEMGILIQEMVGRKVGKYYFPAFAGVAFSSNEFRWSPRIKREDGLIRLVPGLGSRAVDRVTDDYPVLAVPQQPNLRVNASVDEVVRYSPRYADVIDLEEGCFCTVDIRDLLAQVGTEYPGFKDVFSVLDGDLLRKPVTLLTDPENDELVATFEGAISSSPFISRMGKILKILEEKMGKPVDIEFAHDGEDLYLVQCRAQSPADDSYPAAIPRDVDKRDIIFTAHRHVSNGWIPDLSYMVYVDPEAYGALPGVSEMKEVGRAVGKLNKRLPKRRFALAGPGRWGSRGDIKLGVSVTYSDIKNTAMLIEIARAKGGYVPDLSFGTHFFQDLVEARIRYLPLYPDKEGVIFKERFFLRCNNLLAKMLPEFEHLSDVIKVVNVPAEKDGRLLRILMNADLAEAMAVLVPPDETVQAPQQKTIPAPYLKQEEFWRWRWRMAEDLARRLDPDRFGVVAMYVFGSTKNATAGPGSDIDLLIHVRNEPQQLDALNLWLDGWSMALAQINYQRTGYRCDGLLDVHYVTDEDIAARTSWAIKIGAVTDAARPLPLNQPVVDADDG